MKLIVYDDPKQLAEAAAQEIISLLIRKPDAVICMASGNSPKLTCETFVEMAAMQGTDTGKFFFVGLDEWVGIPPETHGSCHHDFRVRLFDPRIEQPHPEVMVTTAVGFRRYAHPLIQSDKEKFSGIGALHCCHFHERFTGQLR